MMKLPIRRGRPDDRLSDVYWVPPSSHRGPVGESPLSQVKPRPNTPPVD